MLRLFDRGRARANRQIVEDLYDGVVAAARQRAFYADYGVPDTFEGRFEMMALMAGLVLRRLAATPAPGPELAQRLVDAVFRHLDPALREMGVGDLAVPKRMKRLAEAFLGRNAAYEAALQQGGHGLAEALERNVLSGEHDGARLARYVAGVREALDRTCADELLRGIVRFPDALSIA